MAFNPQSFAAQAQSFGNVAELMKGVSSSETDKVEAKGFGQDVIFEGEDRREKAKKKYKKTQKFWSDAIKVASLLAGLPPGIAEGVSLVGSKLAGEYAEDKAMDEMGDYKWQKRKSSRMQDEFGKYTNSAAFQDAINTYLMREGAGDERGWGEWDAPVKDGEKGYGSIFKSKTVAGDATTIGESVVNKTKTTGMGGEFALDAKGNEILTEPIKDVVKKEASQPVPSPSFRGDYPGPDILKGKSFERQGQPQWAGHWKTGDWYNPNIRPSKDRFVKGQIGRNFSSLWEGVTSAYNKNIFGNKDTIQEHLDRVTK